MFHWIVSFCIGFALMEWVAWATHKYVMHGALWWFHEDHHVIRKDRAWQKNDFFAFFFAIPSIAFIYFGNQYHIPALEGLGFGITFYGFIYFVIHEVVIHRRWKFFDISGSYVESIRLAHRHHHQVRTREGARNFGMLLPPLEYFFSGKSKKA